MSFLIVRTKPKAKRRIQVIKFSEYDYEAITKAFREQCKLLNDGEIVVYSRKRKGRPEYEVLKVAKIDGILMDALRDKPYEL